MISAEKERLLVVDDAGDTRETLQRNLTSQGYRVFIALSVTEAVRILESTPIDLVMTDLKMAGSDSLDLVRYVNENCKATEVMVITGPPTIEGAVTAVKTGAEEYLTRPFTDEELLSAIRRSLDRRHARKATQGRLPRPKPSLIGLVGESEPMRAVYTAIAKAASTSATALISGESGTGKELVARAIHYSSPRAPAPFVPVNCGAIPEELLESELFGHIKGAFTGAIETRAGFFQTADGGTIFLDEISETSLSMQVKLLRVLQDKEICMVGSTRPRKVDVRILASTNKDLLSLVKKGQFRDDLFFRINVINIEIPPLRERGDDILKLIQHFASVFAGEMGRPTPRFSEAALQVLRHYHWPGNVRELENVVQRLVVMTDGDLIEVPDLPSLMRFSALRQKGLDRTLAEVEAEHVRNVLASVHGNKTHAAQILGIDRKTLRQKLKAFQVPSAKKDKE